MLSAALIIDWQRDFADERGSLYVPECKLVAEELSRVANMSPLVVLTKCWHKPSDPSFKKNGGEWPDHCLVGSWGAKMANSFNSFANTGLVLHKTGYSPFFNAPGVSTGLYEYLDGMGVVTLDVGGVALEYCVRHAVLDALQLGFDVNVHRGAIAAITTAGRDIVFDTLAQAGANII